MPLPLPRGENESRKRNPEVSHFSLLTLQKIHFLCVAIHNHNGMSMMIMMIMTRRSTTTPTIRQYGLLLRILLLSLLSASVCHAFRPPLISQELGCSPTLSRLLGGNTQSTKQTNNKPRRSIIPQTTNPDNNDDDHFFFDPMQLANNDNFVQLREAELKHGRVCMLAMLETMLVPVLHQFHLSLPSGITTAVTQHKLWPEYAVVLITCGILETLILVPRDPQAMPGDYGTGYWGVRDKGAHEDSLVAELENGRLAMMAFLIQMVNEVVTGKSWDEQWLGIFQEWIRQQIIIMGAGAVTPTATPGNIGDPSVSSIMTNTGGALEEPIATAASATASGVMDALVPVLMLINKELGS